VRLRARGGLAARAAPPPPEDEELAAYLEEAGAQAARPPSPNCTVFVVGLRKSPGHVRWESPLVAMQRGEAFLGARAKGAAAESTRFFSVAPVDAQAWIARAVASAARYTDGDAAAAAAVDPFPHATIEHRTFSTLALGLLAQRERVAAGGELWSRVEMLAKLARLGGVVEQARARVQRAGPGAQLTDAESAAVDALAAGRRELYGGEGDAEEGREAGQDALAGALAFNALAVE
jgi:hypothetical protein